MKRTVQMFNQQQHTFLRAASASTHVSRQCSRQIFDGFRFSDPKGSSNEATKRARCCCQQRPDAPAQKTVKRVHTLSVATQRPYRSVRGVTTMRAQVPMNSLPTYCTTFTTRAATAPRASPAGAFAAIQFPNSSTSACTRPCVTDPPAAAPPGTDLPPLLGFPTLCTTWLLCRPRGLCSYTTVMSVRAHNAAGRKRRDATRTWRPLGAVNLRVHPQLPQPRVRARRKLARS